MSYIVGFFAADGWLTLNKRGANFWCIQITDKKLLEGIKKTIKAEHKIGNRKRRENEKIIYRLQIGSKEMCDDLRKIGFTDNKTKNLVVPNIPKKYISDFTRGYFDGDGNVWIGYVHKKSKNPNLTIRTMFTSCSLNFLERLHKKLQISGIKGGYIYTSKDNYSRLQFSVTDSLKLYDFMYNGQNTSTLFLKRKKDVFEKYKNAAVAQR